MLWFYAWVKEFKLRTHIACSICTENLLICPLFLSAFHHTSIFITLASPLGCNGQRMNSLFQVLVHDPHDYPDINTPKKIVSSGSLTFYSIPPWVTYSTPEVRKVPIKNRGLLGCLFPDEMVMRKMKLYSYNNCITECRENYTLELCGCTPFYYPNSGKYTGSFISN